ncbi:unnamed protein product (macronuclear) [Paramecium tetraurelia]|uniref:Transcription factor CBF/NF-Y/archaeal histone domain-containing protein n=1 Tax=Paramecium tetraurelia TaxID=5888 RepID=A0D0M7_PARTE|nr:uncharacterized protein GSPATT00012146001 [Paramecium tetraurelia]CAK76594.1 unnamed protein product [Paramecium tetraurelia]|eukprot:XP_001443991.1 hypothetical protein (macronuclear) [Paramecium tetraurelia strain d4-2]
MINKENFLNKAIQRIRLDEITVKETYFQDDLNQEDRLKEFEQKYHSFRDNFIEYKPNKSKADNIDNQQKLIQALFPGIIMEDITAGILANVTLLYIQEIIETAKELAVKNESLKISQNDVIEAVRIAEYKNQYELEEEFSRFFQ